ncbi:MAG: S41 family peptidase [Mucilaginibacter sp.]
MKKAFYLIILLFTAVISSCKKDKKSDVASISDLLKDSLYMYEKEDYLWNDAISAYNVFSPRGYNGNNDLGALGKEIYAISQLKINPATGKPFEYYPTDPGAAKYSFVDDGTETASLNGTNGDFGFEPIYISLNDLRIKYVYSGSPAGLAGLQRGDEITSINGNSDLTYDGGGNVDFVINSVYYSNTITLTVIKQNGNTATITLNKASYAVNPVLTYKVFNMGSGHKVAYLAFNSFTALANAQPKLDEAFNYFIAQGANDLVVDLRYNGGGAGETAEYMDNLIVPQSKSNTLMYTLYFNSGLQNNNYSLLAKKYRISQGDFLPQNNKVNFSKKLSLALNRVFFIVTNATASSSELTINNLRPELTVQLIGDTTYGKPVGEIPIPIGSQGRYIIFSPQFYVQNSAGQGNYYNGMAPGSADFQGLLAADDVTKDFGDSTEMLLSHALNYVKTGTYAINIPQVQGLSANKTAFSLHQQSTVALKMEKQKNKLMVFKPKAN